MPGCRGYSTIHPPRKKKFKDIQTHEREIKNVRTGFKRTHCSGWRDGSVVKSTCWYCRKPEFYSQHPHGEIIASRLGTDAETSLQLWALGGIKTAEDQGMCSAQKREFGGFWRWGRVTCHYRKGQEEEHKLRTAKIIVLAICEVTPHHDTCIYWTGGSGFLWIFARGWNSRWGGRTDRGRVCT